MGRGEKGWGGEKLGRPKPATATPPRRIPSSRGDELCLLPGTPELGHYRRRGNQGWDMVPGAGHWQNAVQRFRLAFPGSPTRPQASRLLSSLCPPVTPPTGLAPLPTLQSHREAALAPAGERPQQVGTGDPQPQPHSVGTGLRRSVLHQAGEQELLTGCRVSCGPLHCRPAWPLSSPLIGGRWGPKACGDQETHDPLEPGGATTRLGLSPAWGPAALAGTVVVDGRPVGPSPAGPMSGWTPPAS